MGLAFILIEFAITGQGGLQIIAGYINQQVRVSESKIMNLTFLKLEILKARQTLKTIGFLCLLRHNNYGVYRQLILLCDNLSKETFS